jgi:GTP cyclohydrolase I
MSPRRGRRGGGARRKGPAPAVPAVPAPPGPAEASGPAGSPPERPRAGRGGRRHNGRDRRPHDPHTPEPSHEDDDLLEEEILSHRETAADARSPVGASPETVAALTAFLRSLGIDPRRDPEYTVTAQLTADFLAERTAALRREPGPIRPSRYHGQPGETVRLERIPVYGMCPHHLVPYFGTVSVSYVPSDRICGIGAIARLVRDLSCVPRLQERLTQAVADAIERDLEPASVEVVIRARHLCLEMRGVEQKALFVTEARRTAGSKARPEGRR